VEENEEVPTDEFSLELCNVLVGANIPFRKLDNPGFNQFLTKYCERNIPDESTLRKNYLSVSYQQVHPNYNPFY
jgi:hypothetical protein